MKIILEIPRGEVACLLVALNKHATEFAIAAAKERSSHRLAGQPFSAETKGIVEAWDRHAAMLNRLKADIRHQTGVK